MSETTPDPADVHTGTDRVADVEAQIQADFEAHPGSWRGDPEGWFREGWLVQEARLQALAVELDELKEEVSEYVFEYIPLIAGQRDKAEADIDAARAELAAANASTIEAQKDATYNLNRWRSALAERDAARAELAAANARCAELEALVEGMHREVDRIGAENLQHLATLDRVTATLALYDDHPETETFVGKEAKRVIVALCAALTPEGKP